MSIALWIVQIMLALVFALTGLLKVSLPVERLRKRMNWARHAAPGLIRLVGILELLGALGLILPAATHILPWLTAAAAFGLMLTMIGALVLHVRLKEMRMVGGPVLLLLLALFVALGYLFFLPLS
jgi:putative oxidoreductase